jgi:hypothetical protein
MNILFTSRWPSPWDICKECKRSRLQRKGDCYSTLHYRCSLLPLFSSYVAVRCSTLQYSTVSPLSQWEDTCRLVCDIIPVAVLPIFFDWLDPTVLDPTTLTMTRIAIWSIENSIVISYHIIQTSRQRLVHQTLCTHTPILYQTDLSSSFFILYSSSSSYADADSESIPQQSFLTAFSLVYSCCCHCALPRISILLDCSLFCLPSPTQHYISLENLKPMVEGEIGSGVR